MDSDSAFLAGTFSGSKFYCYANFYCFRTKISGGWGQKSLHLSRRLLRNGTDVKWHSVGLTMTSIVEEVTKHIATPCIMCVQYIGGCSLYIGGCSVHRGDTMSTSGGYHEYIGGCSVHRRDTMSTSGGVQYIGGIP